VELHGIVVVLYSEKVGNIPELYDSSPVQKKHEKYFDGVCLSEIFGSFLDKVLRWSMHVIAFEALIGPPEKSSKLCPPSSAVSFRIPEQISHC
jgi:hypothetical protein